MVDFCDLVYLDLVDNCTSLNKFKKWLFGPLLIYYSSKTTSRLALCAVQQCFNNIIQLSHLKIIFHYPDRFVMYRYSNINDMPTGLKFNLK